MFNPEQLHQEILQAIDASEKIIDSLQCENLEQAEKYDAKRAECIRSLSKCQDFESKAVPYMKDLGKLAELDTSILQLSHQLHDEVLTQIHEEQTNRLRHVQYVENQRL